MYRTGKTYKLRLEGDIFYTGVVVEEDSISIRVKTIRDEELILNKNRIVRSELMNGTGDQDEKQ